jgi:hypothetical protein
MIYLGRFKKSEFYFYDTNLKYFYVYCVSTSGYLVFDANEHNRWRYAFGSNDLPCNVTDIIDECVFDIEQNDISFLENILLNKIILNI